MVYINLLPIHEIKLRANAVQQISLFIVSFIGVLILVGVIGFYQKSTATHLTKEITTLKTEKQRFNKILAQIKKLEADKKLIESKITVINQLKKSSALTVHLLDEIANLTPTRRLWIDSIKQSGGNLSIKGMALDNQTIAAYMDKLKESSYINDVTLLSTSQKIYAGRELKSFQLTCSVSVPVGSEPEIAAETSQ